MSEWGFRESQLDRDGGETYDPAGVGKWGKTSSAPKQENNEMANETKQEVVGKLHTPVFRVSFPQVFQPKAVVAGQEPKYSIAMLWPKVFTEEYCALFGVTVAEQKRLLEAMKSAVTTAAVNKWGADKAKWPKGLQSPWHSGEEKDYDGYDDKIVYASASSKIKPGLVDAKMNNILETGDFYGGCYARATVTVFAYDNMKRGVSFGLRNIQKLRDGERFGGASNPEDDFGAIATPETAGVGAATSEEKGGFDI